MGVAVAWSGLVCSYKADRAADLAEIATEKSMRASEALLTSRSCRRALVRREIVE